MIRSLSGDVLRVVLVFALVAFGMPEPLPAAPTSDAAAGYYFQNGRGIYHVDYSDMLSNAAAALEGTGQFAVTVRQARFFDVPLTVDEPFVFGGTPSIDDVVSLGSTEWEVEESSGVDLRRVDRWNDVVTWNVSGSDEEVTTSFRVGADHVALTVPRNFLTEDPEGFDAGAVAVIEANGVRVEVDAALLLDLAKAVRSGEPLSRIVPPAAVEEIAESFTDLPKFVNGVAGFLVSESRARVQGPLQLVPWGLAIGSRACEIECVTCVGALVGAAGAAVGLVFACGSALVTGGGTAIACVLAFLGYQASHLAVFASCAACGDCLSPPQPPPSEPGPGPCPCEGDDDCPCSPPNPVPEGV